MFAFLNDADEANVAVYSPARAVRHGPILRHIHQIEAGRGTPASRLALSGWPAGRNGQQYVTQPQAT